MHGTNISHSRELSCEWLVQGHSMDEDTEAFENNILWIRVEQHSHSIMAVFKSNDTNIILVTCLSYSNGQFNLSSLELVQGDIIFNRKLLIILTYDNNNF